MYRCHIKKQATMSLLCQPCQQSYNNDSYENIQCLASLKYPTQSNWKHQGDQTNIIIIKIQYHRK